MFLCLFSIGCGSSQAQVKKGEKVTLPKPQLKSAVSVEQALNQRRSVRTFASTALGLQQVAQLLWAAQGITAEWGGRTAPSAGATYPLECYLVVGQVTGLKPAVYRYLPVEHSLSAVVPGDKRVPLCKAALGQKWIQDAPVSIVIAADFRRTARRYGDRAGRYVYIEVGHAGQNIHLQCEALGLATVCVGAFDDAGVKNLLAIDEEPIYIMPVGYAR